MSLTAAKMTDSLKDQLLQEELDLKAEVNGKDKKRASKKEKKSKKND